MNSACYLKTLSNKLANIIKSKLSTYDEYWYKLMMKESKIL